MWAHQRNTAASGLIARGLLFLDGHPLQVPPSSRRRGQASGLADSLAGSGGAPRVVLNLSRVAVAGSLFLGRLLVLHRAIQRVEGRLILCCLRPSVQEALAVTKLHMILEMADDEEAALAGL